MFKTRLNTTAKGNAFEERVFNILQKLLQEEDLPLNCKRSKVYSKKSYKSIESNKDIVFDIAIETFAPNYKEVAMLTLIECKDYNSPISVSKVRDFNYRIKEVKANKGLFFTTSYFQEGAVNLARSNRIGLVVIKTPEDLHWITRRIEIRGNEENKSDIINFISGFSNDRNYGFAAIVGNNYYDNPYDFVQYEMGLQIHQSLTIDYLTNEQIISIIYERLHLSDNTHKVIADSELLEYIHNYDYIIKFSQLPSKILGEINFESKNILISNVLEKGTPRWRFTIAHELGHIILHSQQMQESNIKAIEDCDDMIEIDNISDKTIARMEIQANLFASMLLMPPHYFELVYRCIFERDRIRNYPVLTIDNQPCNIIGGNKVIAEMATYFKVSKAAIRKRLLELNYLNEA